MKKRTKLLAVVVATVMAASTILTGCGEKENTGDEKHTIGVILYGKMMHSVRQNMRTLILRRKHWMLILSGH